MRYNQSECQSVDRQVVTPSPFFPSASTTSPAPHPPGRSEELVATLRHRFTSGIFFTNQLCALQLLIVCTYFFLLLFCTFFSPSSFLVSLDSRVSFFVKLLRFAHFDPQSRPRCFRSIRWHVPSPFLGDTMLRSNLPDRSSFSPYKTSLIVPFVSYSADCKSWLLLLCVVIVNQPEIVSLVEFHSIRSSLFFSHFSAFFFCFFVFPIPSFLDIQISDD